MSASVPLSVKRRKLNDTTSRLNRPFVSPLRTSKSDTAPLRENSSKAYASFQPYTPSTLAHTVKPAPFRAPSIGTNETRSKANCDPAKSSPIKKQTSAIWAPKGKPNPEELAAQKAITSLELQIRKVQNDLDSLKQAQQIANSSTDADLEALTEKWRLASQSVAEELFGSVKERVCRMGGAAAWREAEKQKYDRAHGTGEFAQEEAPDDDDADCEFDSQGEELPQEEQEYRKKMKRQAKQEMLEAMDGSNEPEADLKEQKAKAWEEDGKDDDTFTMDMMLRSLNIDLDIIGYDKLGQRWT